MLNREQLIEKMSSLSEIIILKDANGDSYISLYDIEIKKGSMLHSPCFHCKTELETLQTTFTALVFANIIVKNAYGDNRKEFKWSWKAERFQELDNE